MSNYQVEPASKPQALTTEAIKALRHEQVQGVSRRELLRGSLFAGIGLWLVEVTAGSLGFLWPNLEGQFGGEVVIGTLDDIKTANTDLPIDQGFPAFVSSAKAFVILVDPNQQRFIPGDDQTGDGHVGQRPGALPALPAPRLQAQPVPQELLAGVPVPRVALRPARPEGRRPAVRAGAAEHGPLRRDGRRRRRPHHQHRQDHPRPAADRRRPAGDHPAAHPHRVHLTPPRRGDR